MMFGPDDADAFVCVGGKVVCVGVSNAFPEEDASYSRFCLDGWPGFVRDPEDDAGEVAWVVDTVDWWDS